MSTTAEPIAVTHALLRAAVPDRPGLALLSWRTAGLDGLAVQIYLDGRLYDVAPDALTGECWLWLERSHVHRVELLAVEPGDAWRDLADRLAGSDPPFTGEAAVQLARDETLDAAARVAVSIDGAAPAGDGPLWSASDARNGFGGLMGIGAFGWDLATGPGLGLGEFGVGPLGGDGTAWRWRSDPLDAGGHTLTITVTNPDDDLIGQAQASVTIDAPPAPARDLVIDDTLTLRWSI